MRDIITAVDDTLELQQMVQYDEMIGQLRRTRNRLKDKNVYLLNEMMELRFSNELRRDLLNERDPLNHLAHDKRFRRFCEKRHAVENLDFWIEINKFRSLESSEERRERANEILETYLNKDSPMEINISARRISKIIKAMDSAHIDKQLFDRAQYEISKLLRNNLVSEYHEHLKTR